MLTEALSKLTERYEFYRHLGTFVCSVSGLVSIIVTDKDGVEIVSGMLPVAIFRENVPSTR